jgi:hypothetical protein
MILAKNTQIAAKSHVIYRQSQGLGADVKYK